jgi:hypothetical protein
MTMSLIYLTILGTTAWLGVDATRRDWSKSSFAKSPIIWIFGSLMMWIVIFPIYLVLRRRAPLKQTG